MRHVDKVPEDLNDLIAEEIARQIRQGAEQTADAAKARARAMAAQYSHLGSEVDALLADALDDFGLVPDYLEDVFRQRMERVLGKKEALHNIIVVDVDAIVLDDGKNPNQGGNKQ